MIGAMTNHRHGRGPFANPWSLTLRGLVVCLLVSVPASGFPVRRETMTLPTQPKTSLPPADTILWYSSIDMSRIADGRSPRSVYANAAEVGAPPGCAEFRTACGTCRSIGDGSIVECQPSVQQCVSRKDATSSVVDEEPLFVCTISKRTTATRSGFPFSTSSSSSSAAIPFSTSTSTASRPTAVAETTATTTIATTLAPSGPALTRPARPTVGSATGVASSKGEGTSVGGTTAPADPTDGADTSSPGGVPLTAGKTKHTTLPPTSTSAELEHSEFTKPNVPLAHTTVRRRPSESDSKTEPSPPSIGVGIGVGVRPTETEKRLSSVPVTTVTIVTEKDSDGERSNPTPAPPPDVAPNPNTGGQGDTEKQRYTTIVVAVAVGFAVVLIIAAVVVKLQRSSAQAQFIEEPEKQNAHVPPAFDDPSGQIGYVASDDAFFDFEMLPSIEPPAHKGQTMHDALFSELLAAIVRGDDAGVTVTVAAMGGPEALNTPVSVSLVHKPGSPPAFVPVTPVASPGGSTMESPPSMPPSVPYDPVLAHHEVNFAGSLPVTGWEKADGSRPAGMVTNTALMWAVRFEHSFAVGHIIDAGADVDVSNDSGQTPLHCACMAGANMDILQKLLHAGANPNSQDMEGNTPLAFACRVGRVFVVSKLLGSGADPSLTDMCGLNTAALAACFHQPAILELLIGPDALSGPDGDARRSLVAAADMKGWTPLFWAVAVGSVSCVQQLLQTRIAKIKQLDEKGDTVLHLACKEGDAEIVNLILAEANRSRSLQVRRDTVSHLLRKTNHLGLRPIDVCQHYSQPTCTVAIRRAMERMDAAALPPAATTASDSGHESSGSGNQVPASSSESDLEPSGRQQAAAVLKEKRGKAPGASAGAIAGAKRGRCATESVNEDDAETIARKSQRRAEWHRRQKHQREKKEGLQGVVEKLEEENMRLASQIHALTAESVALRAKIPENPLIAHARGMDETAI